MIKGDKDKLLALARDNVCSEHHVGLEVVWDDKEQSNVIRCLEDHYPGALVRTLTEGHKVFDRVASPLKESISLVPHTDLGTGELLLPETVQALIDYAHKYELDPFRGHVVLMYGKPYVTLDGYLWHANRVNLPYQLSSRPLSDDERKTYQIPEGAHAWVSEVITEYAKRSFTGLGVVTQEEMTEKSKKKPQELRSPVVAKHPWQLAQKRAEWQALRRAFPIGEETEESNKEGKHESANNTAEAMP